MPDETQDAKAQKLAAARKKLKEYQQRCNNTADEAACTNTNSSSMSIASNLSERSDCELSLSYCGAAQQQPLEQTAENGQADAVAFCTHSEQIIVEPDVDEMEQSVWSHNDQGDSSLKIVRVLIGEKSQLNAELTKCRHVCREREMELEELRTEYNQTNQQLKQTQLRCQEQHHTAEQNGNQITALQRQLEQSQAHIEEQQTHLFELEAQLKQFTARQEEMQKHYSSKCSELDMVHLRLRQLGDESSVNTDNRIETLTQTQYMYEQQIRDLQQMVNQLTQDKDQAAIQYQNYVSNFNERNSELVEECAQLKERERQLVEHVSDLEREIQKNLSLQAQCKEISSQQSQEQLQPNDVTLRTELAACQERIKDFEFERHEFQLKIKSQDDQLQLKEDALTELQQELQRLQTEQPDQVKLMATMESDKVAASRALSQNIEMKQQLDELQKRFVQLTNDKVELVNKLDSEQFTNREMSLNYAKMEQKLQRNKDRFKFKDDEMIRLSHENVELHRTQLMLQQQVDRLQHYEVNAYNNEVPPKSSAPETEVESEGTEIAEVATDPLKDHCHENDDHHDQTHNQELHSFTDNSSNSITPSLPTANAVEKLQSRFKTLISQVADLTEEKHSLEHLVLQLQSETETIGEYIALYQTQRRILKQREYEKATQMRLLKAEREQLHEKINALNELVSSLGLAVELPGVGRHAIATDGSVPRQQLLVSKSDSEKEEILHKIQGIITEIKENAELSPTPVSNSLESGHAVDHLNCCLGKFEVV
ncbi:hypothetical protein KR222_003018 [Zaprionus bogoriensis]|nr:hypothetical protein KR222_003018 [Zaprionus bogoriensis]